MRFDLGRWLASGVLAATFSYAVPQRSAMGNAADSSVVCGASAASDGVSAEAMASCLAIPDGLTPPRPTPGCPLATYELAVADDTIVAVFPSEVVAGYSAVLDPTAAASDGAVNNFGTALDVLRAGAVPGVVGPALNPNLGERRFSTSGRWWRRVCWRNPANDPATYVPSSVDGPYPEGVEVNLSTLVSVAHSRVDPPPVPPFHHTGPASLVQLPTWFWADEGWWGATYRGEQRHGRVGVVVDAVPVSWHLASGGAVLTECSGPGVAWGRGRRETEGCTYTFSNAADGGVVPSSFRVKLEVVWQTSIAGYGVQSLPPLYRTVTQDHEVIEVVGLLG